MSFGRWLLIPVLSLLPLVSEAKQGFYNYPWESKECVELPNAGMGDHKFCLGQDVFWRYRGSAYYDQTYRGHIKELGKDSVLIEFVELKGDRKTYRFPQELANKDVYFKAQPTEDTFSLVPDAIKTDEFSNCMGRTAKIDALFRGPQAQTSRVIPPLMIYADFEGEGNRRFYYSYEIKDESRICFIRDTEKVPAFAVRKSDKVFLDSAKTEIVLFNPESSFVGRYVYRVFLEGERDPVLLKFDSPAIYHPVTKEEFRNIDLGENCTTPKRYPYMYELVQLKMDGRLVEAQISGFYLSGTQRAVKIKDVKGREFIKDFQEISYGKAFSISGKSGCDSGAAVQNAGLAKQD